MHTKQFLPEHDGAPIYPVRENINALVHTAWILAIICLWPNQNLSNQESAEGKLQLRRLILNTHNPYLAYLECCQRILLCRKRLSADPCYGISSGPADWFNPDNPNGYRQSEAWFQAMQQQRIKKPLYRHSMKAFCEAILDMTEEPDTGNFQYWINWFIRHTAYDELLCFQVWTAKAHYQFIDQPQNPQP